MTTCRLITKPIVRMAEKEGKNLDEIAESVCPTVKHGREKIIRIIKDFLGDEYLTKHADTLGYSVEMAQKAKKRTHQKNPASASSGSEHEQTQPQSEESVCEDFTVIGAVRLLIEQFGYDAVVEALGTVRQEARTPSSKYYIKEA